MLEICNRCKLVIKEKIFNAKTAIFSGNMRVLVNWGICSKATFYGLCFFFVGGFTFKSSSIFLRCVSVVSHSRYSFALGLVQVPWSII